MLQFCLNRSALLCLLGFLLGWTASSQAAAERPVTIQGMLSTQAEEQLDCVFDQLPQQVAFREAPLRRAQHNLLTNKVDGYFGLPFDPGISKVAEPTTPLLIRKWNSYSYDEKLLALDLQDPQLRIGVVDGGNPLNWLLEQGIHPLLRVQSAEQLLELLQKDRLDIVLTDEYSMQRALLSAPELPQLASRFQRYVALSVYFSKHFLQSNPDFLTHFERSTEQCQLSPPALTKQQQLQIRQWAGDYLNYWRSQPLLLQTLREAAQAPAPSERALAQADARWLFEQQEQAQPLLSQVLRTPLSEQLRGAVAADRLLSEALISDLYGQLLAASDITTDYYQGDEISFQQSRDLLDDDLLLEPIAYDSSTQKLAIRVSGPIHDGGPDQFLGVLTLGVDIEQLH